MSVPVEELGVVADRVSRRIGWLELSVQGHDSLLPWSCAQVLRDQEGGAG